MDALGFKLFPPFYSHRLQSQESMATLTLCECAASKEEPDSEMLFVQTWRINALMVMLPVQVPHLLSLLSVGGKLRMKH